MRAGARVLIVDDEPDFRTSLAVLLVMVGYEVLEARDGHDALRVLDGRPGPDGPDVILLDYRMPGLNGGEVLERLRRRGVRVCTILVSASADLHSLAAHHGFDAAVPKPCELDDLLDAMRRCPPLH